MNLSQFIALLVHRELIVFYVGAYFFNYFFNVYDFFSSVGPSLFGLILIAIIGLIIILVGAFTCIYILLLPKNAFAHKIYISIPLAAANIFTSVSVCLIAKFFWLVDIEILDIVFLTIYNLIVAEVIVILITAFSLQRIKNSKDLDQNDKNGDPFVHIFGLSLRKNSIQYMKSDDAYVEVFTVEGKHYTRGKIADAKVQLKDLGFSPHRTYWVSYLHISKIVKENGSPYVIHVKARDEKIPVAKTKNSFVEDLLER